MKKITLLILVFALTNKITAQVLNPILVQKELRLSPIEKQKLQNDRAILARRNVKFVIGVTEVSKIKNVQAYTGAKRVNFNTTSFAAKLNKTYSNRIATTATKVYSMRTRNMVTPIRDQIYCGSCWNFAILACVETNHLLNNPSGDASTLNFSEQQIMCNSNAGTCEGGWSSVAAKWMFDKKASLISENALPYKSRLPKNGNETELCPTITTSVFTSKYKVVDYGVLPNQPGKDFASIIDIKNAVLLHGAVTAAFWADCLVFEQIITQLGGGVLDQQEPLYTPENYTPKSAGHEVAIIGWDDNDQCWIVKNSWGTDWGDNGFGRIRYEAYNIGSDATWVEVEKIDSQINKPNNSIPVIDPVKPVKPLIIKPRF